PPGRLGSRLRLVTAGTGRPARRSTDLLPQLRCPVGAELRQAACGTGALLDRRAEETVRGAPAAVQPTDARTAGARAAPSGPSTAPRVSMEG
ncbi:hypothetical protein AADR41_30685, partial [Streptomyces sp. CLV115]